MATKKSKSTWPKVVQGTHLTVTTYEDGRSELVWDDEQLLKEVREAIASAEVKPSVKAKSNKKVPEAMKRKTKEEPKKASAITGNIKAKKPATRKKKAS